MVGVRSQFYHKFMQISACGWNQVERVRSKNNYFCHLGTSAHYHIISNEFSWNSRSLANIIGVEMQRYR